MEGSVVYRQGDDESMRVAVSLTEELLDAEVYVTIFPSEKVEPGEVEFRVGRRSIIGAEAIREAFLGD